VRDQLCNIYRTLCMWETKFHTHMKQLAVLWFCVV
jgi:hypothetical protein